MADAASSGSQKVKRQRTTRSQRTNRERHIPDPDNNRNSPRPPISENIPPPVESDSDRSATRGPDTDGFITLIVGPKKREFSIPGDHLTAISRYFKNALTRGFSEADSQTITWNDQSPALTERFQRWVYSNSVFANPETAEHIEWEILLDMYILADRFDIPSLQNTVIDAFIDKGEETETYPPQLLHKIYEDTPPRCMLKRFMVDRASQERLRAWFFTKDDRIQYPREFLFDLIILETDGKVHKDFARARADYHVRNEYTNRVRVRARRRTSPDFLPDPPRGPERAAEEGEVEEDV